MKHPFNNEYLVRKHPLPRKDYEPLKLVDLWSASWRLAVMSMVAFGIFVIPFMLFVVFA